MGTDISETATLFLHMHAWDFQDDNRDWERRFDFVYTSSLDQVTEPARTLQAWAKQNNGFSAWFLVLVLVDPAPGVSP